MHIEHEEALRADFAEYVRLEQQAIRVSLAHHDGGITHHRRRFTT